MLELSKDLSWTRPFFDYYLLIWQYLPILRPQCLPPRVERSSASCKRYLVIYNSDFTHHPEPFALPGIYGQNLPSNHHIPINWNCQSTSSCHIQDMAIFQRPSKLSARRLRDLSRVHRTGNNHRAPVPPHFLNRVTRACGQERIAVSIDGEIVIECPRGRRSDFLSWAGGSAVCVDADRG